MKVFFSAYDFFAYLAAGFVVIAAVDYAFCYGWIVGQNLKFSDGILVVVVAYLLGHIVALFSSIIFERGFVYKVLKSPEVHLLSPVKKRWWNRLFPRHFAPFPDETIVRVKRKAQENGIETVGRGLFLHCHTRAKTCQKTAERLSTILNQYGFCRNLSLALLVAAVALAIVKHWEFSAAALLAAIAMLYRYLKFFRHYTREVYLTYSEMSD